MISLAVSDEMAGMCISGIEGHKLITELCNYEFIVYVNIFVYS
jgi:hypothetical protein